jgi:hypothetical protein
MTNEDLHIIKASGEKVKFSMDKVENSLGRAGASKEVIDKILSKLQNELYDGITTKEVYNRAFTLLKKKHRLVASKYKLKKAIYELGPTGFPFERFVAAVLDNSGYGVEINRILKGKCVSHEVDILAKYGDDIILIECKFHSDQGRHCDVKIPLYIHSRYQDIYNAPIKNKPKDIQINKGWLVTNTRFTSDALKYGLCIDLYLLSWDFPIGNGLKDRIDESGLYPITVSTLLTKREKNFLLSRDVVLCKELIHDNFYLDHLGITEVRKAKILNEMEMLCAA